MLGDACVERARCITSYSRFLMTTMPLENHRDPRSDFPILERMINGRPLVYLDNAATTQKPQRVLDRVSEFLAHENANIHRGVHYLSMQASNAYDQARARVARFIKAEKPAEIVFVRGATEAINLVARSFAAPMLEDGDEILVTEMEHHANIVPWQLAGGGKNVRLVAAPISDSGVLDLDVFEALLSPRTKLVAVTHVSNVLGTINPVRKIVAMAHARGIPVLVDGAQAVAHQPVDVCEIGCDFYVFSGHKLFGPDGIGVLYGREELLAAMAPYQGGGDMIEEVAFERSTFRAPPERFEAGTPNISGAIGLAAAIDYVDALGWDFIREREEQLSDDARRALRGVPGLKISCDEKETDGGVRKAGVLSFTMEGAHPHDAGTILDASGIAVRAGHHCAQPLMRRLGVPATVRASFAFYNTSAEIDLLVDGLAEVNRLFGT